MRKTLFPPTNLSPECDYMRAVIAKSLTNNPVDAQGYVRSNYRFAEDSITKALVSDIDSDDMTPGTAAKAFFDRVWERSIFGQVPGWRMVDFNSQFQSITDGAVGYWVAQHQPVPISKATLAGDSLETLKIAALMVFTNEALRPETALAEARLLADMEYAIVAALNDTALDPSNAGVAGESPASLLNGATTVTGTGDPSADVDGLIDAFQGDWEFAAFVSDPTTLTRLANFRDSNGTHMYPDIGPRGGALMGVPCYASRLSPQDSNSGNLSLIDPSGIAVAMDDLRITPSKDANIAMVDGDIDSNSELDMVSMFQTDATALKVVMRANWKIQRTGSVAYIADATW